MNGFGKSSLLLGSSSWNSVGQQTCVNVLCGGHSVSQCFLENSWPTVHVYIGCSACSCLVDLL